jgi:UDP-N-acetylmuramoyl-L-alanyl-D-glutamate--2,6-diaminopimelate ligase
MLNGLKMPELVHQEIDRAKAIAHVVKQASARDVILIAGKGHEDTQEIAGVKHVFDDRIHAHEALVQRANCTSSLEVRA